MREIIQTLNNLRDEPGNRDLRKRLVQLMRSAFSIDQASRMRTMLNLLDILASPRVTLDAKKRIRQRLQHHVDQLQERKLIEHIGQHAVSKNTVAREHAELGARLALAGLLDSSLVRLLSYHPNEWERMARLITSSDITVDHLTTWIALLTRLYHVGASPREIEWMLHDLVTNKAPKG